MLLLLLLMSFQAFWSKSRLLSIEESADYSVTAKYDIQYFSLVKWTVQKCQKSKVLRF